MPNLVQFLSSQDYEGLITYRRTFSVAQLAAEVTRQAQAIVEVPRRKSFLTEVTTDTRENALHIILAGKVFHTKYDDSTSQFADHTVVGVYNKAQNDSLHLLLNSVLDEIDDQTLYQLLMQKNNNGDTPLHILFDENNKLLDRASLNDLTRNLLRRIGRFDDALKQNILNITDKKANNILHKAYKNLPMDRINNIHVEFGANNVKTALTKVNIDNEYPIHSASKSPKEPHAKVNELLNDDFRVANIAQLLATQNRDKRNILQLTLFNQAFDARTIDLVCQHLGDRKSAAASVKDDKGLNALHFACEAGDIEKIKAITRGLTPAAKFALASAQTDAGWNALHYAAHSGDELNVKAVLKHLDPTQQDALANTESKPFILKRIVVNGDTPLHIAAKHGNKSLVERVMNALKPENLFKLTRDTSSRKSRDSIDKFVTTLSNNNKELTLGDFYASANAKVSFFLTFDYLKERFSKVNLTKSRINDIEDRIDDFVEILISKRDGAPMPADINPAKYMAKTGIFFNSSENYHAKRVKMQTATQEDAVKFIAYLNAIPAGNAIADKIKNVLALRPEQRSTARSNRAAR